MARGNKKGKGLLKDQIANLRASMTPDQISRAEKMANDDNEFKVVALAFKLHDRPYRHAIEGLTKKQEEFYAQMAAVNQAAADAWKNQRLAEIAAKAPATAPVATTTAPVTAPKQAESVKTEPAKGGKKLQTA